MEIVEGLVPLFTAGIFFIGFLALLLTGFNALLSSKIEPLQANQVRFDSELKQIKMNQEKMSAEMTEIKLKMSAEMTEIKVKMSAEMTEIKKLLLAKS